jgi:hypothetical protein
MAEVTKKDRTYPRPAEQQQLPEKRAQRAGGPSMRTPGDGGIVKDVPLPGDRGERSSMHFGDAMSSIGGSATEKTRP